MRNLTSKAPASSTNKRQRIAALLLLISSSFLNLAWHPLLSEQLEEFRPLGADGAFEQLAPALKLLVTFEKNRPYLKEASYQLLQNGEVVLGSLQDFSCKLPAEFGADSWQTLPLNAYWLAATELTVTQSLPDASTLTPFQRWRDGQSEYLFLIHPLSAARFDPARLAAFEAQRVYGLVLRSPRTLLVAIPPEDGDTYAYALVKLDLNCEVGGINRSLGQEETIGSVLRDGFLRARLRENPSFAFFHEPFSLLPRRGLLTASLADTQLWAEPGTYGGMIVRSVPAFLQREPSSAEQAVIPLFSLLGQANSKLLEAMIHQSGLEPVAFISDYLLKPFASLLIDCAFDAKISPEFHPQNLLVKINTETLLPEGFLYRDLGGLNIQLDKNELEQVALPPCLEKNNPTDFFYQTKYHRDLRDVLRDKILRGIFFNLTKTFIHNDVLRADPDFAAWELALARENELRLDNWLQKGLRGNDEHSVCLPYEAFIAYGFFELRFIDTVVAELKQRALIPASLEGAVTLAREHLDRLDVFPNVFSVLVRSQPKP